MVLKEDLLGKIRPAVIVDRISPKEENEMFAAYPITDVEIKIFDGRKHYVTSTPAGPVTMSGAEAHKRLELAKVFDRKVRSHYLPDLKAAEELAQENFPDYASVASTKYKQRLAQCLDGEISRAEEDELIARFKDSGIGTLTNGSNRSYFQRSGKSFMGTSRDKALETLRAYANFEYFMRDGTANGYENAVAIARDFFPHLVKEASAALDERIQTASDESFWLEHAKPHSLDDYVIRG